ncbi:hypothetical protein BCR42DRAFT_397277 [Absidia repens]|uniref:Uncharacterized protein n=1 Tax=Absidia repens TaxID=90262 RepID=A0A1X2I1E2_9FUNG|nr:hypothetical protein BCR42DRAFT_397277 [Absidia repens]
MNDMTLPFKKMGNIYERDTYILAVPDLHIQHLENVSNSNVSIIFKLQDCQEYLYSLIQKRSQLYNKFLDNIINVPRDQVLRRLVTEYTHCSMNRCETWLDDSHAFDSEIVLERLYNTSHTYSLTNHYPCADATAQAQTQLYTALDAGGGFAAAMEWNLVEWDLAEDWNLA